LYTSDLSAIYHIIEEKRKEEGKKPVRIGDIPIETRGPCSSQDVERSIQLVVPIYVYSSVPRMAGARVPVPVIP
jgi:hypothetical protein